MTHLKKMFFYTLFLTFVLCNYSDLYPDNGWPTSFSYYYLHAENPIEYMFKDEIITRWFNQGYNPDDRSSPITKNMEDLIIKELDKILHKTTLDAVNKVKNCPAFNKLFGDKAEKFLSGMKNKITFLADIPQNPMGTTTYEGIFVKGLYLKYMLYHIGKQAREIENGQREGFDLNAEHFNEGWGSKAAIPITKNVVHEIMHVASGFNGGGREAECIVHCLTKKCIDPDHDFTELTVGGIGGQEVGIDCNKIEGFPGKVGLMLQCCGNYRTDVHARYFFSFFC